MPRNIRTCTCGKTVTDTSSVGTDGRTRWTHVADCPRDCDRPDGINAGHAEDCAAGFEPGSLAAEAIELREISANFERLALESVSDARHAEHKASAAKYLDAAVAIEERLATERLNAEADRRILIEHAAGNVAATLATPDTWTFGGVAYREPDFQTIAAGQSRLDRMAALRTEGVELVLASVQRTGKSAHPLPGELVSELVRAVAICSGRVPMALQREINAYSAACDA